MNSIENEISIGTNINLKHNIIGGGNTINIGDAIFESNINIYINGNNNYIEVRSPQKLQNVSIRIGSHVTINNCKILIDTNLSCGENIFLLYQHNTNIKIGKNCLFSSQITFRTGEVPHLIFDSITGEYIDNAKGILIGNHVWIGEKCFIQKNAIIPNNTIIGSASVVTKKFDKGNTVIAGNPARVCKENVHWEQNWGTIDKKSIFWDKLPSELKPHK